MKHLYLFMFLISSTVSAQVNTGPRFTALASAGVSLSDPWSMQQNQAGLASVKRLTVAIAIESPFVGFDLSTQSIILILPVRNNVVGLSYQRYGVPAFREERTAFCYARNFGDKLYAALNFNYHSLNIENYGVTQTYSVEAGLQYRLNPKFTLGVHVANPSRSIAINETYANLPFRFQIGASYNFSEKVMFCSAYEHNFGKQTDAKFGMEYQIFSLLYLRGGVSANPFKQYAGFGVNYHQLRLDIATSSHPALGYSPQIALSYEF